jgi:hypothetical protein
MNPIRTALLCWLAVAALAGCGRQPRETLAPVGAPPEALFPSTYFETTTLLQGETLEHTFTVRNVGGTNLLLNAVEPGPRVEVLEFDRVVGRGKEGVIRLRLATEHAKGKSITGVVVKTNDPHKADHRLSVMATVVPVVEVGPQEHAYLFDVLQGTVGSKELTLTNHQPVPLEVLGTESDNDLFSATVEAVEAGQRYRLEVHLDAAAAIGKHQGTLTLLTDSPAYPRIFIPLLATVKGRIFARPEEVAFGKFYRQDLSRRVVAEREVQILRLDGKAPVGVRILASSLPFLAVELSEPPPGPATEGTTVAPKLTLRLRADELPDGPFAGTLTLETDDEEFPQLVLTVSGEVVPEGTLPGAEDDETAGRGSA